MCERELSVFSDWTVDWTIQHSNPGRSDRIFSSLTCTDWLLVVSLQGKYVAVNITVQLVPMGQQQQQQISPCVHFWLVLLATLLYFKVYNFSLSTPLKRIGMSRGLAPLIPNLDTRWG
jgi:hypothetical protein